MAMLSLVLLGFAWPLTLVTCDEGKKNPKPRPSGTSSGSHEQDGTTVRADLMVRSAHPFRNLKIMAGGRLLAEEEGPSQLEEFEVEVLAEGEVVEVTAQLQSEKESALRIEVWPDGLPGFEETLWGHEDLWDELEVEFVDETR